MRTTTPSGYCGCAPRPPARGGQSRAAPAPCGKMAPAGRGCGCSGSLGATVVRLLLLLLGALACARATEHYSPLSLLKQELQHRQQQEAPAGGGCPQSGDWADQYPECESSFLNFHESDCELRGSAPCDSLLSLNTEKILVSVAPLC